MRWPSWLWRQVKDTLAFIPGGATRASSSLVLIIFLHFSAVAYVFFLQFGDAAGSVFCCVVAGFHPYLALFVLSWENFSGQFCVAFA